MKAIKNIIVLILISFLTFYFWIPNATSHVESTCKNSLEYGRKLTENGYASLTTKNSTLKHYPRFVNQKELRFTSSGYVAQTGYFYISGEYSKDLVIDVSQADSSGKRFVVLRNDSKNRVNEFGWISENCFNKIENFLSNNSIEIIIHK